MKTIEKLKVGQKAVLDTRKLKNYLVEIIEISPMKKFAVIKDESGNEWVVPSEKLSPDCE